MESKECISRMDIEYSESDKVDASKRIKVLQFSVMK